LVGWLAGGQITSAVVANDGRVLYFFCIVWAFIYKSSRVDLIRNKKEGLRIWRILSIEALVLLVFM
jgi:hypothetical protein